MEGGRFLGSYITPDHWYLKHGSEVEHSCDGGSTDFWSIYVSNTGDMKSGVLMIPSRAVVSKPFTDVFSRASKSAPCDDERSQAGPSAQHCIPRQGTHHWRTVSRQTLHTDPYLL